MNSENRSYLEADEPVSDSPFQPKKILQLIIQRWYWLLLGLLLGLGWGFYQAWKAVPIYRSQATVLVRDYSVSILQTLDPAEFDVRNAAALETIRTGMMKFELCERVASNPEIRGLKGLIPPPPKKLFGSGDEDEVEEEPEVPPATQLAGMIQSWLKVSLQKESRLMAVVVEHPNKDVAAVIANAVVDEYIKQRAEVKEDGKIESGDLLEAQAERLQKELSLSKTKLAIYESPNRAEQALVTAEQEFNTIKLRYRHKHPKYIEAERKAEQAVEQLRAALKRVVVNPTDQKYWANYSDLVSRLDDGEGLESVREKLIERRAQLETEIESQSKISETLMTQVETLDVNKAKNEAEVIPYEKARPSGNLVSEAKTSLITKNSLFGLIAGVAIAFLFQLLDNKFHTVDELEARTSMPVLAAIPQMNDKVIKQLKGGILPGREAWAPTLIFGREESQTIIAESFRVLRAALSLLGPAGERKTTLVTSSLPSEGKTTVASNLACSMAQEGKKIVLVDLDLRKPSLHKSFGLSKDDRTGSADILSGNATFEECLITETGQPNLHLILSGNKAPNPGELLNSETLKEFLDFLKKEYYHIVIDTAPILAVADSRLLVPLVENFLFVVRAETTPKGAVDRALEVMAGDGKKPSGLVLNDFLDRRTTGKNKYRYGYYRSNKYSYGSYGSED